MFLYLAYGTPLPDAPGHSIAPKTSTASPPFCKLACHMKLKLLYCVSPHEMYVVYALLYCVSQLEMLFAHELTIWPNQLGVTLGRGTPHLQDIMNSVETWKTVWRNTTSTWHHELCWDLKDWSEETPPGEIILVSLAFKVPSKNELFCLVQSQTIFIFKYYPRGQPMYYFLS